MFDIDALEELSLGNFDVGIDVDDKTIDNEFDVDNEATEGFLTLEEDLTGAEGLTIRSSVYFKHRTVFDIDALEELLLGNFDVGIDVNNKTIDNEFNVDDEATEDGVTGAAAAAKRERFLPRYFTGDLCLVGNLPFFPLVFRDPAMMKTIQGQFN